MKVSGAAAVRMTRRQALDAEEDHMELSELGNEDDIPERIHHALYAEVLERESGYVSQTTAIIDSEGRDDWLSP